MSIFSPPTNLSTLQRRLQARHVRLLALGTAIGVGLFLGSGNAIKLAGPAVLLSYLMGGIAAFFILRALGEMTVYAPITGSFSRYAYQYIGPLAGYLTGWTYWFMWLVTCIAEITAVGIYMQLWFPAIPPWMWALAALALLGTINLFTIKLYGEIEFWFALIKIITIIAMIALGLGIIIFGVGNHGVPLGIGNLWKHNGFLANGFTGVIISLQMVMYGYLGIEMIGITAGETARPEKIIPSAINSVVWRIGLFYIGSLFVILSLYPWSEIGTQGSPFVLTFERLGIKTAAGLINFVVITAALSSCNGGIYSTTRMLFNLAEQKQAPSSFSTVSSHGIPHRAVAAMIVALLTGVGLNYLAPGKVFIWATSVATFAAIWTWLIIIIAQLRFRKTLTKAEQERLNFRMPFYPYSSYLTLVFLMLIIGLMAYLPDTRIALLVGPLWLAFLGMGYYFYQYKKTKRGS